MNNTDFEFIKGYENLYKINRNGEIYSCWYKKIMVPQEKEDGYLFITLKKEGIRAKGLIHRLLMKQYIVNTDNHPEVDHIDRNKHNNNIENLRWCSRLTNARNKATYKDNLTPEQLEARKARTRERARIWATKQREATKLLRLN